MPKNSTPGLLQLADELLLAALHYLDGFNLMQVACVCLKLRALVFDDSLECKWLQVKKQICVGGGSIYGLMILDDGRVFIGSKDGMIHIWNWPTGELEGAFPSNIGQVYQFALPNDGALLCRSSISGLVMLNPVTGECIMTLAGHEGQVTSMLALKNYIVSGGEDGRVQVWAGSGECKYVLKAGTGSVTALTMTTDGDLVCGYWYGDFIIVNLETGVAKYTFDESRYDTHMPCLVTTKRGHIITAFDNGLLCIFNPETYVCDHEIQAHDSRINCLLVTPEDDVLTGSTDGTIRLWGVETGTCKAVMQGHKKPVIKLKTITKNHIVSTSADNTIRIWNLTTGECEQTQAIINLWPFALAVDLNGTILCGANDGTVTQLKYAPKPQRVLAYEPVIIDDDQELEADWEGADRHDHGPRV